MQILMIDDSKSKQDRVRQVISGFLSPSISRFDICESLAEAAKQLPTYQYDLIIVDLMLPYTNDGEPQNLTGELLKLVQSDEKNKDAYVIALSAFQEIVDLETQRCLDQGLICIHYEDDDQQWEITLQTYLMRIRQRDFMDFVVVCALEKEFSAYTQTTATIGERAPYKNLDAVTIDIEDLRGICVKLPTMGPVSAAVITSKVIEVFSPKLVTMSGICAGVERNCRMGQLIVAGSSWDYQSGKWERDHFNIEPYPVDLDESTRVVLSALNSQAGLVDELEAGLSCNRPQSKRAPQIAPFATGSSVLAQAEKVELVAKQHRKAAGIDMEMYGLYRAARLSGRADLKFFGAKTVVDFGDEVKDDKLQEYGSIVSARFVTRAIPKVLDHH